MPRDEEFEIGSQGIDTRYEREYINYRPKIQYEKQPTLGDIYGSSADTVSQNELEQVIETSIIQVWEDILDTTEQIKKLETVLIPKIKDIVVPIPSELLESVKVAAEQIGYVGSITTHIPFELYQKTFEKYGDSPAATIIRDIYEEYMSDISGNLNAEIYTDLMEIREDWNHIHDFTKKALLAQFIPYHELPNIISIDDPIIDRIRNEEKKLVDEYIQLLKLQRINEQIYEGLSGQYTSKVYLQAVNELDKTKQSVMDIEKKMFTRTEIVDLIARKASDVTDNLHLIQNSIDFDPYKSEKYEVLYTLLKQFDNKSAMIRGLSKVQALLKLSLDDKKSGTNRTKQDLRGIAGSKTKQRINRTLINGVHVRNGIFREVFSIMNSLDGIPKIGNFEILANHISEGVQQAEGMYQQQLSDFYKIHAMDTELRMDRMASLIDKDAARGTYKMLDTITEYAQQTNVSWPKSGELSQWLSRFMENN